VAEDRKRYVYRNPRAITRWLKIASFVLVALFVASLVSYVLQYIFLLDAESGAFVSRDALVAAGRDNDARVQVLAALSLITLVVAQISFFVWLYRAVANVHALGAEIGVGAGLAIGLYFIPLVNLFLPAVSMSEIVRGSEDPVHWKELKGWWLVPVWWVLWIAMNIGGYAVSFAVGTKDMESLKFSTALLALDKLVETLAWIALLVLISRVSRLQIAQGLLKAHVEQVFG